MGITVKVIDCMHGGPAQGITGSLTRQYDGHWGKPVHGRTDEDGLLGGWQPDLAVARGVYRLELDVDRYYAALGIMPFYPQVVMVLRIADPAEDHNVFSLITPYLNLTCRREIAPR